jgi:ketosteroid isomerase-like protein
VRQGLRATAVFGLVACAFVPAESLLAQTAGVPGGTGYAGGRNRSAYYAEVIGRSNEVMAEWRDAWGEDDAERAASMYHPDALLMLPGRGPVVAREGIAMALGEYLPNAGRIQAGMVDFDGSDRMAYISGAFNLEMRDDRGVRHPISGQHVTVLFRERGDWRIRAQLFKPDGPVLEGPPLPGQLTVVPEGAPLAGAVEPFASWVEAWADADADGVAEFYQEEGALILPHGQPTYTRAAIAEELMDFLPASGEVEAEMLDFDQSGRIAYVMGRFEMEDSESGGTDGTVSGDHFTILFRNGRDWFIRFQMFRPDNPLPGGAPAGGGL